MNFNRKLFKVYIVQCIVLYAIIFKQILMIFISVSCESPIYIHPHSKIILNQAINDDAEFLTSQLVMDYSLLVGQDEDSGELVLGIIGNLIYPHN